jgi:hypothetical protein
MNKLAVMQPYFFPYIGYFKLIKNVDNFIFLIDVQYKKRSWISRNKIRSNNKNYQYININIERPKINSLISEVKIKPNWFEKFNKILLHTFGKKISTNPLYLKILSLNKEDLLINFLCKSIIYICDYLNIKTNFFYSINYRSSNDKKEKGIIEIIKNFGSNHYINLSGGQFIYNKDNFLKENINGLKSEKYSLLRWSQINYFELA